MLIGHRRRRRRHNPQQRLQANTATTARECPPCRGRPVPRVAGGAPGRVEPATPGLNIAGTSGANPKAAAAANVALRASLPDLPRPPTGSEPRTQSKPEGGREGAGAYYSRETPNLIHHRVVDSSTENKMRVPSGRRTLAVAAPTRTDIQSTSYCVTVLRFE